MKILLVLGACALALLPFGSPQQGGTEARARGWFAHGSTMRDQGNYAEALKDFNQIIDTLPETSVADNALLEVARYQFDVQRDLKGTEATLARLKKDYPKGDAIPWAWVLSGRIGLARRTNDSPITSAINDLDRVIQIYSETDAVPAALYYKAEAERLSGRTDAAKQGFVNVVQEYSRNTWAARALLGVARCSIGAGDATGALQATERVRDRFPGSTEADTALAWNTIIFRLYLRGQGQSPYEYTKRNVTGRTAMVKDVRTIAISAAGEVIAVLTTGVSNLSAASNTGPAELSGRVRDLFIDSTGRLWTASSQQVTAQRGAPLALPLPNVSDHSNEHPQVEDISSFVVTSLGELLVGDHKHKATFRFTSTGKFIGRWMDKAPDRMAIDSDDSVAILKDGVISIVDRDGQHPYTIPSKGANYELKDVRDLAFDSLGQLYVLDRSLGNVVIFSAKGKYINRFGPAEKALGAFRRGAAIAVDKTGRLFVYDERNEAVQVYE